MAIPRPIALACLAAAAACPGSQALAAKEAGASFETTFRTKIEDLGTRETATREVDGLTIIYPKDEADVVDLLLPDIRDYRAKRQAGSKSEAGSIVEVFSSTETREKYRKHIAGLLALESLDDKAFDAHYAETMKQVADFARRWRQWSGDLGSLRFWSKFTAKEFERDGKWDFPEVAYDLPGENKNIRYTIRPPFLKSEFGAELIALSGGGPAPLHLDVPLIYPIGRPAEEVARQAKGILADLPDLLQKQAIVLAAGVKQGIMEALLRSTIRTEYFPKASGPQTEALIHGLARCYLVASMKSTGALTSETEADILPQLTYVDLSRDKAKLVKTLDPLSGNAAGISPDLQAAAGRLVFVTLMNLAQEDDGTPIFQKLEAGNRTPKGGFASVGDFVAAVEAIYPGRLHERLLATRAEFAASVEASAAPEAQAPPVPPAKESPRSDRETLALDGLTISFPPPLKAAVGKLGPEILAARKKAAAELAARLGKSPGTPVEISDSTLAFLEGHGLEVSRGAADYFATGANALSQAKKALFEALVGWDAVQIWFRDDLKATLTSGGKVPGFSYDSAKGVIEFLLQGKGTFSGSPGESKSEITMSRMPLPIVLPDRKVLDLEDAAAQAKMIREKDKAVFPMLESIPEMTDKQLGLTGDPGKSTRSADETFFIGVHELVEESLIRHVIASDDRRWFCEGVANLLALQAYDHQLGKPGGKSGRDVFESLYDPARLGKLAAQVDLLKWPTAGDEPENLKSDDALTAAHYYFATLVLMKAMEGRGGGFLGQWIAEIRKTPWNRTNAGTVIAAYGKLTGKSLREIIEQTVSVTKEATTATSE